MKVDTGRIELDASLHNSLPTSELASLPTESIGTSGPWYDAEEGRYVEETTPDLGLTSSTACLLLPHNQTHQQGVGSITQSTSVESALLPKSSDSGDDGWTDENMAELKN